MRALIKALSRGSKQQTKGYKVRRGGKQPGDQGGGSAWLGKCEDHFHPGTKVPPRETSDNGTERWTDRAIWMYRDRQLSDHPYGLCQKTLQMTGSQQWTHNSCSRSSESSVCCGGQVLPKSHTSVQYKQQKYLYRNIRKFHGNQM